MIIKLRGKIWKQINIKEFNKLENSNVNEVGFFRDIKYNENTYFKLIEQNKNEMNRDTIKEIRIIINKLRALPI